MQHSAAAGCTPSCSLVFTGRSVAKTNGPSPAYICTYICLSSISNKQWCAQMRMCVHNCLHTHVHCLFRTRLCVHMCNACLDLHKHAFFPVAYPFNMLSRHVLPGHMATPRSQRSCRIAFLVDLTPRHSMNSRPQRPQSMVQQDSAKSLIVAPLG